MAINPVRGEAELVAGERGTLKLCFDVNAFCFAEERLAKTTDEIVADVQLAFGGWTEERLKAGETPAINATLTRTLLWAGLQKHHPGTHLIEAGEIISDAGIGESTVAVLNGFFAAFGASEDGEGKNPPQADESGSG